MECILALKQGQPVFANSACLAEETCTTYMHLS